MKKFGEVKDYFLITRPDTTLNPNPNFTLDEKYWVYFCHQGIQQPESKKVVFPRGQDFMLKIIH